MRHEWDREGRPGSPSGQNRAGRPVGVRLDRGFIATPGTTSPASTGLDDMGEFVRQQGPARWGMWRVLTAAEQDGRANRDRAGTNAVDDLAGAMIGEHAHMAEVVLEA